MRSTTIERSYAQRSSVAVLVGGLHILIGAALLAGGIVKMPVPPADLQIRSVTEKVLREPAVLPLPPTHSTLDIRPVDTAPRPQFTVEPEQPGTGQTPSIPSQTYQSEERPTPPAPAHVLRSSPPEYPDSEVRLEHVGVVQLRILIDANGRAEQIEVTKSSGFRNLDAAAMRSVRGWLFEAAHNNGAPIASWATLKVRFDLR